MTLNLSAKVFSGPGRAEVEACALSFEVMLAVLLGAALHASWNALVKSGADPFLDIVLVTACSAGLTAAVLIFLPLPRPESWGCLAASVLIHLVYYGLLALAYRGGALSVVYPIMRGSAPAFSALAAAIWLNEHPSWGAWAGIFLISGGVLLLAADAPQSQNPRLGPVVFACLNAAVIVSYTLVDGLGARLSGNAFSYTGWVILLTSVPFSLGAIALSGGKAASYVRNEWKKGGVGASCTFASYSLALWAMTRAPIAPIAALRETSIVFSVFLALFVLKEKINPLRYVAIAIVTAGAVAIKIF
jgi:drug/metabolite transporter (DMT)-like permease